MKGSSMFRTFCGVCLLLVVVLPAEAFDKNGSPVEEDGSDAGEDPPRASQTYSEAEKEIVDFVNSLLKSLLPQIVGGSGEAKLSSPCTAGMMKVFGHVRRMKGWTLKILDSMGKPSSGILRGTTYSMGDYDECLDLKVTSKGMETADSDQAMFQGQYCRMRIKFPEVVVERARGYHQGLVNGSDLGKLKDIIEVIPYIPVKSNYMNHFLGMCFPSICSLDDLQQLAKLIPFPGTATVDRCDTKTEVEVDSTQLVVICLFLGLALLVVISSCIHWLVHSKKKETYHKHRDRRCINVSVSFSLCSNTSRLVRKVADDSGGLLGGQSVRGVVVASIFWIVLGHTYLFPQEEYYFQMSSLANLREYWNAGYFSVVVSFPLAIEALCVCSGFLLTYSLWQPALNSKHVKINIISLVIKNYIRLCLPLCFFFGLVVLLPLLGSGPFWGDLFREPLDRCQTHIGAHFGMYSNFMDLKQQCFQHLWFVSCLAQLTLAGIFLSFILSRNIKIGVGITFLLSVLCNGAVGLYTLKNELPPSYVAYFAEKFTNDFWRTSMSLPLSHFGSYAAGMLAGILVARKECHRSRKLLGAIGWIACLSILIIIFIVLFRSRDGSLGPYWSGVFAALHKTAFGICVSWILVACSFGMGGFVNSLFSWRVFDPLFRLSYYAYVFHLLVIAFVVSAARDHTAYSHVELMLRIFSYTGVTYIISYFLFMLLEMPLESIRAALFSQKACQIEVTPLNNFPISKGHLMSKSSNTIEGTCKLWSITETHNGISY